MRGSEVKAMFVATFLGAVLIVSLTPVHASEEDTVLPQEVLITADAGKDFGSIALEIKTDKNREKSKITSMRLKIGGKWVLVPPAAYADLAAPLLNRAEIRIEPGYDPNPWLYIYFEVAAHDVTGVFAPKRVHIAYHSGKFEYRSVDTPLSDGSTRWDKIKL